MRIRSVVTLLACFSSAWAVSVDPSEAPTKCLPLPIGDQSCSYFVNCSRVDTMAGVVQGAYQFSSHTECITNGCDSLAQDGCKTSIKAATTFEVSFQGGIAGDIGPLKVTATDTFKRSYTDEYVNEFTGTTVPRKITTHNWDLYKQVNATIPVTSVYTCRSGYTALNLLWGLPCSGKYLNNDPVTYDGGTAPGKFILSEGFGAQLSVHPIDQNCPE